MVVKLEKHVPFFGNFLCVAKEFRRQLGISGRDGRFDREFSGRSTPLIQYADPTEKTSRRREHRRQLALFFPELHHQRTESIAGPTPRNPARQPNNRRLD